VRAAVSFVVVILLAGATLEGQEHAPAKTAAPAHQPAAPAKPTVAPPKPAVHEATAKPTVAPAAAPAKPPVRTLEQAAEAIAAALAARGVKPASRPLALRGRPAPAREPRMKRYSLYWPEDDIDWQVQWPIISGRVALSWDDPATAREPASD
jgi:hypothetical protein